MSADILAEIPASQVYPVHKMNVTRGGIFADVHKLRPLARGKTWLVATIQTT
jgi:hypothetical protein